MEPYMNRFYLFFVMFLYKRLKLVTIIYGDLFMSIPIPIYVEIGLWFSFISHILFYVCIHTLRRDRCIKEIRDYWKYFILSFLFSYIIYKRMFFYYLLYGIISGIVQAPTLFDFGFRIYLYTYILLDRVMIETLILLFQPSNFDWGLMAVIYVSITLGLSKFMHRYGGNDGHKKR